MVLTIVAIDFARGQGDEGFQVQDGRRADGTLHYPMESTYSFSFSLLILEITNLKSK